MSDINKYILPGILIILGLILVIAKFTRDQNMLFLIGGVAILIGGVLALLNAMDVLNKQIQFIVFIALILGAVGLAALDYKSIKDPIDFQNERNRRYEHVEQRLKDIRTAQMAYKAVKGGYADSFEKLLQFVTQDSFIVIKALGTVPDTLTEDSAVILGIVRRDTSHVLIKDSIYSERYMKDRTMPFDLDSLPYVPFTGGVKFRIESGQINKNNVMVPVFQITDSKPFDKRLVYQVGSMIDPITSGNWE